MVSFADPILVDDDRNGDCATEAAAAAAAEEEEEEEEEEEAFLGFVDYARTVLSCGEKHEPDRDGEDESRGPSWSWVVSRILKTCSAYSSGVTAAILLSDLSQSWNEQYQLGASRKRPECITQLKKKHRRTKLPNTVTIDSIYEKNFVSMNSILEAVVVDVFILPGTNIYMLSLGDFWSSNTIDMYLHRRYYDSVDLESPDNGTLKKGREIFVTGCCLRAANQGSGRRRLLPTEYLVILLDENEDEDAMLLGAQFCSDSFSTISLDAVQRGASYSFYARIESIGLLEIQGKFGSLQRKQINLVDSDGVHMKFSLWGEQVILANFFSLGSMLAVDRPFVASSGEGNGGTCEDLCLEYGTATQLYLVPYIQHEEQICVAATQNRYQGSRVMNATSQSQGLKVSQVTLPCNSEGTIDFSNYPFRACVTDLRPKMTSIHLYGTVTDMCRERCTAETIFKLTIQDRTGAIVVKLHFVKSWSLGRLNLGHAIYISGLTCYMTSENILEASWFEKDPGSSFANLSCLPALLNSSCLHKLSYLTDLSIQTNTTYVCNVQLDHIEHFHVNLRLTHALCGHFLTETPDGLSECTFCRCPSDEVVRTIHLKTTLADESTKVLAWCTGPTASEILQIAPDEFCQLSEDEQAMYPYTLENEKFMVAIVNSKGQDNGDVEWEIVRALKCE